MRKKRLLLYVILTNVIITRLIVFSYPCLFIWLYVLNVYTDERTYRREVE